MKTQMRMHMWWPLALSLVWLAGCTIHTSTGPKHPHRDDDSADVAKHKKKKKKKDKKEDSAQASTNEPPATPAPAPAAPAAEPSAVAPVAPATTPAPSAEDERARKQREREEKLAAEKEEAARKRQERIDETARKKKEREEKLAAEKEEAARKRQERIDETARKKAEREAEKQAQAEKEKPALSPAAQIAVDTSGKATADRSEEVAKGDGKTPADGKTAAGRKRKLLETPHRTEGQPESDPRKNKVRAALSGSAAEKVESLAGKQSERVPGSTTADKVERNSEAENVETLKKK